MYVENILDFINKTKNISYHLIKKDDIKSFKYEKMKISLSGMTSFDIFNSFTYLIYLSFEHELNARNSQLYTLIRSNRDKSIPDLRKIFEDSYLYKVFRLLKNFNVEEFTKYFDSDELLNLINEFNKSMEYKDINKHQIGSYLDKWKHFFNRQYNELPRH